MDAAPGQQVESPRLQRKLFLELGPLVALIVAIAICAIVLLQGVLSDLSVIGQGVADTGHAISTVAARVMQVHAVGEGSGSPVTAEALERELRGFRGLAQELDGLGGDAERFASGRGAIESGLAEAQDRVGRMRAAGDAGEASRRAAQAMGSIDGVGHEVLALATALHEDLLTRQSELIARFRWVVVGLTMGFFVLLNAAVVVLLRTARLILRPVHDLVQASRRLAQEDFTCRVELQGRDEFDELASAFNELAAQLQEGERRRIETLRQVARAVNHELNNALSILELQLDLIERTPENKIPADRLRQIHETLERMSGTVRALGNVRRIVLTDYMPGTPMLDLRRSSGTLDESDTGHVAIEWNR